MFEECPCKHDTLLHASREGVGVRGRVMEESDFFEELRGLLADVGRDFSAKTEADHDVIEDIEPWEEGVVLCEECGKGG